eukprot:6478384-Amphidinium_carterae.1
MSGALQPHASEKPLLQVLTFGPSGKRCKCILGLCRSLFIAVFLDTRFLNVPSTSRARHSERICGQCWFCCVAGFRFVAAVFVALVDF